LQESNHPQRTRPDLVVREQNHRDINYSIIKDPVTRRFFRLPRLAWLIAGRFDSQTPIEQVAAEVTITAGEEVGPDDVRRVADQMERLGLLDLQLSSEEIADRQGPATHERRSVFYLKRPLFDPDGFLTGMLGFVRPLLSRPSIIAIGVLVFLAVAIHAVMPGEPVRAMSSALEGSGIAWLYAVTILTLTIHELAHGLTARLFGAEVREMGVMLLYFMPCAYTDISDAYLVPRKRDRIWITLAGSVVDLAVWAIATIVLAITNPEGTGLKILGALILTTGFRSIACNLNPLIKLDGYYVLVDLLEMPNLRFRARTVVLWRFSRWLGRDAPTPDETARDRRVLEIYGWLSMAYVAALLSVTAVLTDSLLVEWAGPWGRLAWAVIAALVAIRLGRRLMAGTKDSVETDGDNSYNNDK